MLVLTFGDQRERRYKKETYIKFFTLKSFNGKISLFKKTQVARTKVSWKRVKKSQEHAGIDIWSLKREKL